MSRRNMLGELLTEKVAGVMSDLLVKLGRPNGEGKQLFYAMKSLLRDKPETKELSPEKEDAAIPDWEIWREVHVGRDAPWMRRILWRLWRRGWDVEKGAREMFLSRTFTAYWQSSTQINLAKVSLADLGITMPKGKEHYGAPLVEVMIRAREMGLELCPAGVVHELPLQHHFSSGNALIMTTMFPLSGRYGIFGVTASDNYTGIRPVLWSKDIYDPYLDHVGTISVPEMIFSIREPVKKQ